MKILAIRGKNLASLAGEFEIYFNREPLASANLFAICGPTGSGKSTLLDALCLALYDETPRLTAAAKSISHLPDVGDKTITSHDPRNLLRRGSGDSYAEVDFVGNDGVEYRARWSVQRAHRKADRPLQDTKMELKTLADEQSIGGKKTEVLEAIRKRLGLQFDQFTRAVLLAQNEFAAFLKADNDDRGILLQTLTGLDIYEKVSIRAHQRAKAERQALDNLSAQLKGHQTLTAEERAELEQKLATAKAEASALAQRKAELEKQIRWHETWENLKQAEQQAREAVQEAISIQESATHRRAYFTRAEAVQDARSVLEGFDRAAAEVDQHHQATQTAKQQRNEAQHLLQSAEEAKATAAQAVFAAEQQRANAGDALHQARNLDAEINALAPGHEKAVAALKKAHQDVAEAQARLDSKKTEYQQVAQQLQIAQAWLTKHQPLQVLAKDWSLWDKLLKDAANLQNSLCDAEQKAVSSQRDTQKKRQERDKAADECAKAKTALHAAEIWLQAALAELAGFDAETLAARRQAAQTRAEQLASAEQLWTTIDAAQTQQRKLEDESRTLREQVVQAENVLKQLDTDKPLAAARLEQAEKSLRTAEAACAENVETLRRNLEAGSPCPVCGATGHPYAIGDAPSRAMLAGLKADVDECRKILESLVARESAQQTGRDKNRQRLTVLAGEQESLAAALRRDHAAWNAHPLAAELTAIAPGDYPAWLTDQKQLARIDLADITEKENVHRKAAKKREDAQKDRDQAEKRYSTARDALNTAENAFNQAMQTTQIAAERKTDCDRQLGEKLTALEAAFSGHDWRPLWQADPVQFHEQRRQKVAHWNDQNEKAAEWQKRIGELEIEIKNNTAIVNDKTTQQKHTADEFQRIDSDLKTRCQKRKALFGGRSVVEVETELDKATEDARRKHQQQDEIAQKAKQEQVSAETALNREQEALAKCQQAAEQAMATLRRWVAEFNANHPDATLDIPELRALLLHDNAWLKGERETLKALADAVKQAETILKERQAQRETHERQRANQDPAETAREAQQKTQADLADAQNRAKEAEIHLRQNDERREKAKDLQEQIDRQEGTTRIWNQLDQLIGSSDGKKFRNYAQQFTLDVLLGYANRHLADLSRRYRLERVKDTLALMVVDQDMGDEPRSVHSLSGGESFLVSLALALGLASLSSNRVRVESLFIDEGFGSLDADTLRVAMDALDKLQAQGRKVGIISHVQDMTERIGTQIQVRRQSSGQSWIEVRSV
ncbi:MAG TPA: AAA family ATPase [Candidatus Competibacter sp.]|nr:AAA family ATPase [Candidatus Competibacter sp.]